MGVVKCVCRSCLLAFYSFQNFILFTMYNKQRYSLHCLMFSHFLYDIYHEKLQTAFTPILRQFFSLRFWTLWINCSRDVNMLETPSENRKSCFIKTFTPSSSVTKLSIIIIFQMMSQIIGFKKCRVTCMWIMKLYWFNKTCLKNMILHW